MSANYHGMLREQLRLEHESHLQQREESLRQLAEHLSAMCRAEKERLLSGQKTYYQLELARARARLAGVEGLVDTLASSGNAPVQYILLYYLYFYLPTIYITILKSLLRTQILSK